MTKPTIADRFWKRVDRSDPHVCWIWPGNNSRGYGVFKIDRSSYSPHRVAWTLANVKDIPDGMLVRHDCDQPRCVNPNHLILGSRSQNNQAMVERGRRCKTPRKPLDLLTQDKIRYHFMHSTDSIAATARRFGVTRKTVSRIVNG